MTDFRFCFQAKVKNAGLKLKFKSQIYLVVRVMWSYILTYIDLYDKKIIFFTFNISNFSFGGFRNKDYLRSRQDYDVDTKKTLFLLINIKVRELRKRS